MSAAKLYEDLWRDECARCVRLLEQRSDLQMETIRLKAEHGSMLFTLRLAANCLDETFPGFATEIRDRIKLWSTDNEKTESDVVRAIPGGSTNEAGSGAIPEAASKLESPQGIQTPHCYSTKPPAIPPVPSYSGEWDEVSK